MSSDSARERWHERRQRVLNRLGDGLLLIPTAPLRIRNGDVHHTFRPASDFHYLTGFDEPDGVLAAYRVSARRHHSILFLRPRDPATEVWDGPRLGPKAAVRRLGVDEAFPIESLYEKLEELLSERTRLFYTLGADELMDRSLGRVFERLRALDYRGNPASHPTLQDPVPAIARERLIKDAAEIAALERAANVSAAGHRRAMQSVAAGQMEFELQAELEVTFRRLGSRRNGYDSIVASGANACILHYVANDGKIQKNDLVLIDAGAEIDLYTADITRAFPASGSFSDAQRAVYSIVLKAQKAAIRAATPGRRWHAPHDAAVRATIDGLRDLGILRGARKNLIAKDAHRPWFMHGTSHWLGMDVHDVGGYKEDDGTAMKLRAGMVLTIEPGLYFGARDRRVPKAYRGIGVRIEDDVLITRTGNRVLTDEAPKEIRDVEAVCQSRS